MKLIMLFWLIFQEPPLFTQWDTAATIHYEIKNLITVCKKTEIAVSYVGFYRIYKNSKNPDEYALTISKYPSQTLMPKCSTGANKESVEFAQNYAKKEKTEELDKLTQNSDVVAIAKWTQKKDERTGEKTLNSKIESWLKIPNGWIYELSDSPAIFVESMSESDIYGENEIILVGFKIFMGDQYNILRFDQQHLKQDENRGRK